MLPLPGRVITHAAKTSPGAAHYLLEGKLMSKAIIVQMSNFAA
jgi:hypothetical protein